ncbi:MAG: insulinase family protein [Coriobacteriia bacterium]|nr:insulinase family protein [Coriobacteriia bacterium]
MPFSSTTPFHGFLLEQEEDLPELEGHAYLMRHTASGARLLYVENDDPEAAFSISFKTPPRDDTGVFHILEHSVLCGSDKFPVKEPFVNLLKNSMQTFLNAMTFPDKTMYPVASTNEQDLMNLADVYLDAVLHPAIYSKPETFQQEGWHLELDEQGNPFFNGVVFNEMKGALCDPDAVLYNKLCAQLFPETAYRFESGGIPAAIPTLTYQQFLDTHAQHYRLDNSYLMLYGKVDADAFLAFLDERYLTPCATLRKESAGPNALELQEPVCSFENSFTMETTPDNSSLALGYVVGTFADRTRLAAIDVLLDAITGSNEAPLKKALLDAGIACDIYASLQDGLLQPFVMVQAKGLKENGAAAMKDVLERTVRELAEGGLNPELVEAAINHAEFVLRERNFGVSDGVAFAMTAMTSWLYDDAMPTAYLHYEDTFAFLREHLQGTYYQQLLREVFLENNHAAGVELVPIERDDHDPVAEQLARMTEGLTQAQKGAIVQDVAALRDAQERPDSPEDVAKLPRLGVSDLGPGTPDAAYEAGTADGLTVLRHEVPTHGIDYVYRYFNLAGVSWDDLPYVSLLTMMLGKLPTKHHSAADLDTAIQSRLGNLDFYVEVHENKNSREDFSVFLGLSSSALDSKAEALAELADEVLTETLFEDSDKMLAILEQKKLAMELGFANNGHSCAASRASSYYLPAAVVREQLGGVDFYLFLKDVAGTWDKRMPEVTAKLAYLAKRLFVDENCMFSYGGTPQGWDRFLAAHSACSAFGRACETEDALVVPAPVKRNEAFAVPTDITFASLGYDRTLLNSGHSGVWLLAMKALTLDYLWNEVRVKGGAYGVGFQTIRTGNARFYSYRDPHLDQTVERFKQAAAWLEAFQPDKGEFEGYVVSTVAGIDSPVKPRNLIHRQVGQHFSGIDPREKEAMRREVIAAESQDVRALAPVVARICDQDCLCAFGNADIIEASALPWTVVRLLDSDE